MNSSYSRLRLKQVAYLAGVLIPAFLATAWAAPQADEIFSATAAIFEPGGATLGSIDIGFDDPVLHRYFLADRANKAVDRVNTDSNAIDWVAAGAFSGGSG